MLYASHPPKKSHAAALTPNVKVLGGSVLGKYLGLKELKRVELP